MKEIRENIYVYIAIFLLTSIGIYFYFINQDLLDDNKKLQSSLNIEQTLRNQIIEKFITFQIEEDSFLVNEQEKDLIKKYIKPNVLYLRIPQDYCSECVIGELNYWRNNYENLRGHQLVLLTSFSKNKARQFSRISDSNFVNKNIEFKSTLDQLNVPYYIHFNKRGLMISYVFKEIPKKAREQINIYMD